MSPNAQAQGERLIVDAARAGNASALSELYTLYFPRVYRYILARTGNTYDAEDLAEEVFMRVLEAIERFQWREAPFSAWLFRIAHNAVISQRRKDTHERHRKQRQGRHQNTDPYRDAAIYSG